MFWHIGPSKKFVLLLLWVGVMLLCDNTHAQGMNLRKLLMPGDLSNLHAELEQDCQNCHTSFNKAAQNQLCLDCHEEIADDISTQQHYHGNLLSASLNTSPLVSNDVLNCQQCHTDHRGREQSLTRASSAHFDHDLTAFALVGKHASARCESCHQQAEPKREADTACISCHREEDAHKGNLGETCQDCHSAESWLEQSFDHSETTDFTLRYSHETLVCTSCHIEQQYEDTPQDCHQCHALDDVHAGGRGNQCANCHDEKDWSKAQFDHAHETEFALKGSHAKLNCKQCHRGEQLEQVAGTACIDCHQNDDTHLAQRGEQCGDCHSENTWSESTFNHSRATDFPLKGKHRELACESCHRRSTATDTPSNECIDCHRSQDIHEGNQGENCARCHSDSSWVGKVAFEHDLTDFPLSGLHALTSCEECHVSKPYRGIANQCLDCHEADDIHELSLGKSCETCHTSNGWSLWVFDHNEQTDFTLDGKHADLSCSGCHREPVKRKVNQNSLCVSCHRDDDIHDGEFGRYCESCHNTQNFDQISHIRR